MRGRSLRNASTDTRGLTTGSRPVSTSGNVRWQNMKKLSTGWWGVSREITWSPCAQLWNPLRSPVFTDSLSVDWPTCGWRGDMGSPYLPVSRVTTLGWPGVAAADVTTRRHIQCSLAMRLATNDRQHPGRIITVWWQFHTGSRLGSSRVVLFLREPE